MRLRYSLLAVGACFAAAALTVQPARPPSALPHASQPRVVVSPAERDLGDVVAGDPLRAEFTVHNAGSRRLVVREDVCSACGPGEWLIEPRHTQHLTFELQTAGLEGPVHSIRHYTTSDPLQPRFSLAVRARVQKP